MAKGVKHYLRSGEVYSGPTHKMKDGKLHTGAKHTASSKPLFHMRDLSETAMMPGLAKKKKLTPRQKKLAAMTPPRNKITRGDVITAAKKKAKKK